MADVWSGITLSESPYGYDYDLGYNGRTDKTDQYLHGAGSWPICDWGEKELSLWLPISDSVLKYAPTGEEYSQINFLWGMTQERTGVKVNIDLASTTTAAEKFPLLIAAGDYPDIMTNVTTYYSGGLAKALEDEVIAEFSDYIDEYMPNYQHWMDMTPSNAKESRLDDGSVTMIYSITMQVQPAFCGPMIRTDWLKDAGLDIPTTIDDWYEMLTAFKSYSASQPLDMIGTDWSHTLTGAYGVNNNTIFIQKDGKIEASVLSDSYRDYLTEMNKWFSEGLINKDFASLTLASMFDMSRIINNESGAQATGIFTMAGDFYGKIAGNPDMMWECIPNPTLTEGGERHIFFKGTTANALASGGVSLSADLSEEDLIVAMRMLDWQFTEEGTIAGQYGKEGESFTFDENGHPFHTAMITANENGESSSNNQDLYMCNNTFGGKLIERETDVCDEIKKHHLEVWQEWGDWNLEGTLSYTSKEAEERSGKYTDAKTYIDEFSAKAIMGDISLTDENWNEYLETVEAYGMPRVVEITQAAYDRYLAR